MGTYKKKDKWYYQFMLNGERKHGLCSGASDKKEAEHLKMHKIPISTTTKWCNTS